MSAASIGRVDIAPGAAMLMLWLAYLMFAPTWGFFWIESWHNEQRATEVMALVVTAATAIVVPRFRAALVPRSPATLLLWLVVLLGAVSSLNAAFVTHAFAEVSLYVLLGVLVAVTARCVRDAPRFFSLWVRRACGLLALIHITGIGARYAAMLALERAPDLDVLLLGYANPRFPSAFYALLMPFVAMLVLDPLERIAVRRLGVLVLVFLWSVNIAFSTRAIWFAYALALPLMVLLVGRRKVAPMALVLASTAAGGICVYYLLFVGIPAWLDLGSALPVHMQHLIRLSDRAYLWRQSLDQILAHPLLGVGPMNMAGLEDSYFASHPHNWVLQVAAEWGVPAVVALCSALWLFASNLRAQRDRTQTDSVDLLAPLAAVAIGLCYGLVDGNLVMPVSQIAFVLMLGALLGAGSAPIPDADSASRPIAALVAMLVAASAGFLLAYVIDTLPRQAESERVWRQTARHYEQAPRFWQQGLLR